MTQVYTPRSGHNPEDLFLDPYKKAKDLGLLVFETHERLLLIDLDGAEHLHEFQMRYSAFLRFYDQRTDCPLGGYFLTHSKNGNFHAYVYLNTPMMVMERIALQGALGSDSKRDLLSIARVALSQKDDACVVLFETAEEAEKLRVWLTSKGWDQYGLPGEPRRLQWGVL